MSWPHIWILKAAQGGEWQEQAASGRQGQGLQGGWGSELRGEKSAEDQILEGPGSHVKVL
jgi:hypothetical protein